MKNQSSPLPQNGFSRNDTYRRKIDAGEGYRIVAEDEPIAPSDDFGYGCGSGVQWSTGGNGWAEAYKGITPAGVIEKWNEPIPQQIPIVAIRRKIEQPASAATSSGHFIVAMQFDGDYEPEPYVFATSESASREAQRLAAEYGGKFVVFQAIRAYERPAMPAAVEVAI